MTLTHLTPEVGWTFMAIVAALGVATLLVAVRGWQRPEKDFTELRLRLRTWWIIVGLFGLALVLSRTGALVFFAVVSALALREYLTLVPLRPADRRVVLWAYLSIPLQYYWIEIKWYGMFIIFIPVYLFLFLPTRMVLTGVTQGFLRTAGALHWGLMTTVFSLSHAALLLVLEPGADSRIEPAWPSTAAIESPGPGLLLFLVLLTECNDVFQYLWGKTFGRIRVAPTVSPGKTLAGLLGGVGSTLILGGLLGPWLTFLDLPRALLGALLIGVSGFAGDLSISALKRDLGIKDSGDLLPGHGGILDRVDSLTYTAPLFFHFVYYCYG